MSFRRIIFWSHLSVGVAVGLIVFLLSATGVLLTYERQMLDSAEIRLSPEAMTGERLTVDELAAIAQQDGAQTQRSLVFHRDPARPVEISAGRGNTSLIHPYTGEPVESAAGPMQDFFRAVTSLHRYLAMSGEARETGAAITGAANLAFLFILVSGFYLWWPKAWRWSFIKLNVFFRTHLPSAKARDYNWHHVFGIWALVPLLAVVISGVVISYPWAANLVTRAYGEAPSSQRGPGPGPGGNADSREQELPPLQQTAALQDMFETARMSGRHWRTVTVALPTTPSAPSVEVTVDTGNGAQYDRKHLLTFDRSDGGLLTDVVVAQTQTPARRARIYLRFLHTGEVYGWWGQTLAGLGSLAALFLVWTGLALAWRRLVLPVWRKRRS
ncbi:PepSY-associated TM helix domain-containing protein [Maricaulis sp.]|uniref:PepSY-associated TM helix domain-containing protein n=1 Tax=Maricaulis sp. TaxID=1486257 RepID=UPI003A90E84F